MSSRKEQKEQLKQERLAREAQRRASEARRKRLGLVLGVALGIAAIAVVVVALVAGGGDDDGGARDEAAASVYPDGGEVPGVREEGLTAAVEAAGCELRLDLSEEGREHTAESVRYRTNPPTSGNHFPEPAQDGLYGRAPRKEELVHSLEHGRVIVQFDADRASRDLRANLKALFDDDPYHVILTPNNTNMPGLVAASAWRNLLTCPEDNDRVYDALRAFTRRLRDRGPERVP